MSNDKTLKVGDKVSYFGREGEVLIPDLGVAYWTRGARIRYTTGDRAGQLDDVPIANLRPLAESETAAGKARAEAEKEASEREAKREEIREELIAKAAAAVELIVAYCGIDLHVMTKEERDSILCGVVIATDIRNDAIANEAIDRVKNKTQKETT